MYIYFGILLFFPLLLYKERMTQRNCQQRSISSLSNKKNKKIKRLHLTLWRPKPRRSDRYNRTRGQLAPTSISGHVAKRAAAFWKILQPLIESGLDARAAVYRIKIYQGKKLMIRKRSISQLWFYVSQPLMRLPSGDCYYIQKGSGGGEGRGRLYTATPRTWRIAVR